MTAGNSWAGQVVFSEYSLSIYFLEVSKESHFESLVNMWRALHWVLTSILIDGNTFF